MHALANDPTAPDVIRRAFARVTCQIVRRYSDTTEGVINMTDRAKADREVIKHAEWIGHPFKAPLSPSGFKLLLSVEVRDVA